MTQPIFFHFPSGPSQPPSSKFTKENIGELANWLAWLLDASFTIPGTKLKLGLDPLLGLFPGIGDVVSNGIGATILFWATQAGVPRIVIFRMTLNLCLNMGIGAIPGVGDIFSIWFKSNLRNAQLLHRHCQPGQRGPLLADWLYVLGILTFVVLLMILIISALAWIFFFLMDWLPVTPNSSLQ